MKNEYEFPCTECGCDAFIGYSNWIDRTGAKIIKDKERLCTKCARKRNISFNFQATRKSTQPTGEGSD